ncbi:MAG TPA: outer membrane beta-barrel protein [Polyangiaceae bacterium]|nr:outer membrane beta-barrel protein [Polyangiaceae bacterium]
MRIPMLGSISVVCLSFATSAWAAPADPEGAAPPATTTAAPSPPPAPPRGAPSVPDASPETAPSPKPLTGPVMGPLPPEEAALPPLPSSAPAIYDAPPPPPPPKASRRSEWGVQLRLESAPMGGDAAPDAGMGGIGFSLRPRPSPYFAIDFGLDFMGGRDFNGDKRSESAFTVNPMLFLNPRSKVQIYLLAGLGLGGASVERSNGVERRYRYVGADAGAGLEFRFWRHFAFSGDVVAFVRDRADVGSSAPEYLEANTGRYTDSSAGALFRLGGAYYW